MQSTFVLNLAISARVYRLEDLLEHVAGILQSYLSSHQQVSRRTEQEQKQSRRARALTMVDPPQPPLKAPQVQLLSALGIQLLPQLLHALVALVLRLPHLHLELGHHVGDLHDERSWQADQRQWLRHGI